MNDDAALTALKDRLGQVRDELDDVHMSIPADDIFARARTRRTRRWITAAGAVCAAAGLAVGLLLPSGTGARSVHIHLAAWSVNTNPNGTVTLTVRQLTHAAQLQRALAEAGVPAIVTFGEQCLNTQNQNALQKAGVTFKVSAHPPGEIITPSQIPAGTKLLFSLNLAVTHSSTGGTTRGVGFGWGLVKTGQPLHCTRGSGQINPPPARG